MSQIKAKIFRNKYGDACEIDMNNWLTDHKNIKIMNMTQSEAGYGHGPYNYSYHMTITLLYKERKVRE
jgi:hypothetical protein